MGLSPGRWELKEMFVAASITLSGSAGILGQTAPEAVAPMQGPGKAPERY